MKSERHRLEAELLMYQADRSKIVRRRSELDAEKRVLQKELEQKEQELARKENEIQKVIVDIQNTDNELFRLRKRFGALT